VPSAGTRAVPVCHIQTRSSYGAVCRFYSNTLSFVRWYIRGLVGLYKSEVLAHWCCYLLVIRCLLFQGHSCISSAELLLVVQNPRSSVCGASRRCCNCHTVACIVTISMSCSPPLRAHSVTSSAVQLRQHPLHASNCSGRKGSAFPALSCLLG
jgi:hypothetical protein